jgi:hypothetical protein
MRESEAKKLAIEREGRSEEKTATAAVLGLSTNAE